MAFDLQQISDLFSMQNFLSPAANALKMALQGDDSKLIGKYFIIILFIFFHFLVHCLRFFFGAKKNTKEEL